MTTGSAASASAPQDHVPVGARPAKPSRDDPSPANPSGGDHVPPPSTAALERDATAWDQWVESQARGSYLQLSAWAEVKATNGWTALRLASGPVSAAQDAGGVDAVPVAAIQVLLRRPRPFPWAIAYAPRGPVLSSWTTEAIAELTERVRDGLRGVGRVSHLRIDPEVERDGPDDPDGATRAALRAAGWRSGPSIQPPSTRLIDLRSDEDALWSDLRKKWRQYVNKARGNGIRVVAADGSRLGDFYRIYRETADRAGFIIRAESAYRDVWDAFDRGGRARLLFAETRDGEPVCSLFLIRAGGRMVEPYGGMTTLGAESRANYLLKWEAIRRARDEGAEVYDLWGLAHPGIAQFKAGFGGREVRFIGGWDLVLDPLGRQAYGAARAGQVWLARRRHGLSATTATDEA